MTIEIDGTREMSSGDTETVKVNFASKLEGEELLTGTPTVEEVSTSDLTLSAAVVNTLGYNEEIGAGNAVAVGNAVIFSVTGSTAGTYNVKVTATTDAGNTISRVVKLRIV